MYIWRHMYNNSVFDIYLKIIQCNYTIILHSTHEYTSIYLHTYTHIHTYVYIYIHTYIHTHIRQGYIKNKDIYYGISTYVMMSTVVTNIDFIV